MKFIVSSSQLLKQLQHINGVINANTVLPILEDFLFEVEAGKLTVVATDLETVMRIQLDIEAKESGKVCIPAKILMDSLKNIPDQPLTFTIDKNFGIEITSDNGKYKVMGENIAYNQGFEDPGAFAVERWTISAGHRANLLSFEFRSSAVGSFVAADGTVFLTQLFILR